MSEACAFCMPDKLDDRTIHQNALVRSFLSAPKFARGHALVIPNRHVEPPERLTSAERDALLDEAERLRDKMLGGLAMGVDIFQKSRPFVPEGTGTKMDHEHFHVVPSNPGEELYEMSLAWGRAANLSDLTVPETQEMIEVLQV